MRWNVLTYVVLVFFTLKCTQVKAQESENYLKVYGLRGKVKSLKQSTFEAIDKFGVVQKGKRIDIDNDFDFNRLLYFNENGDWTTIFDFDSLGNLSSKTVCTYDSESKLIELTVSSGADQLTEKHVYNYIQGRISQIAHYDSVGNLLKKTLYEYDNMNQKIESREYLVDGTKGEKETWAYDKQGVLVEHCNYRASGALSIRKKYDKNGNNIENNFTQFGIQFLHRYDKNGNAVESTLKNTDGETKSYYEYNSNGDKIRIKHVVGKDTDITAYEYTYDQHHRNWIKRIEYHNSIPKYFVEREIEYYQ